jgi:hypothetical protein
VIYSPRPLSLPAHIRSHRRHASAHQPGVSPRASVLLLARNPRSPGDPIFEGWKSEIGRPLDTEADFALLNMVSNPVLILRRQLGIKRTAEEICE